MAFPTTSVIETFTGTNGSLLDSDWTTLSGANPPRITNNQAGNNGASGAYVGAYWDVETFGADCEAFVTIAVARDYVGVYARLNPVNDDSYQASWSGSNLTLQLNSGGGQSQLDSATVSQVDGQKLGIECVGSTIKVYTDTGGGWVERLSAVDTTLSGAGNIGWDLFDGSSQTRVDDFGGGTVVGGGGEAQQVDPAVVASTAQIFAPTLTTGEVTVSPALVASTAQVFAPTFDPGGVTISPELVASSAQVFAPSVGAVSTVEPDAVAATSEVFAPTVSSVFTLEPATVASGATVPAPTISVGAVTVSPALVGPGSAVFVPSMSGGDEPEFPPTRRVPSVPSIPEIPSRD